MNVRSFVQRFVVEFEICMYLLYMLYCIFDGCSLIFPFEFAHFINGSCFVKISVGLYMKSHFSMLPETSITCSHHICTLFSPFPFSCSSSFSDNEKWFKSECSVWNTDFGTRIYYKTRVKILNLKMK